MLNTIFLTAIFFVCSSIHSMEQKKRSGSLNAINFAESKEIKVVDQFYSMISSHIGNHSLVAIKAIEKMHVLQVELLKEACGKKDTAIILALMSNNIELPLDYLAKMNSVDQAQYITYMYRHNLNLGHQIAAELAKLQGQQ
jgi:hypothetical protein